MSIPTNYLTDDVSGELTIAVTRLLRDTAADNSALILSILEGGGVNKRLLGYLFGIAVFHHDKTIVDKGAFLLRKFCTAETVKQAAKLREGSRYHYNEAEYLGKYKNPEFDLLDFILAYKMVEWHRPNRVRNDYFIASHQTLNLAFYQETVLSQAIENLDFVRTITLPTNKLFDLKQSFEFLSKLPLESICIEGVRLDEFPTLLFQHPNIKSLTIKRGGYRPRNQTTIPPDNAPFGCASLERFVIDGYTLQGEEHLGHFPNLVELSIQRCNISNIAFLKTAHKLQHLNLKFNQLEEIPAFLSELTELRTLALSGNPLKKINLNLENLPHFEDLDLRIQTKPHRWY